MKSSRVGVVVCAGLLLAATGAVVAAEKVDLGKREYDSNCAVCHGAAGKGDGSYAELLTRTPSDLTKLQRMNAGTFPFARVYEVIDGTQLVAGHGPRDMPIWGNQYKIKAAEYYVDVPYNADAFVRARILALTEYVSRLQAK